MTATTKTICQYCNHNDSVGMCPVLVCQPWGDDVEMQERCEKCAAIAQQAFQDDLELERAHHYMHHSYLWSPCPTMQDLHEEYTDLARKAEHRRALIEARDARIQRARSTYIQRHYDGWTAELEGDA